MKQRLGKIMKIILGMAIFYFVACLLGYGTYYITFSDRSLSFINFLGIYAIILQIVILVTVSMKNNDK